MIKASIPIAHAGTIILERLNPLYLMLDSLASKAPEVLVKYGIKKILGREAYLCSVLIKTEHVFTHEHQYHESHISIDKYYKNPLELRNKIRFKLSPYHYRETQLNEFGDEIISRCFLDLNGNYIGTYVCHDAAEVKINHEQVFIKAAEKAKQALETIFAFRDQQYQQMSDKFQTQVEVFSTLLDTVSGDFSPLIQQTEKILAILKERALFHPKGMQAPEFTFFSKVLRGFKASNHPFQKVSQFGQVTEDLQSIETSEELKESVEAQQKPVEKATVALDLFIQEVLGQLSTLVSSCAKENNLVEELTNLEDIRIILTNLIPYVGNVKYPSLSIEYEKIHSFLKEKKEMLSQKLLTLIDARNKEDIQLLFSAHHEELPLEMRNGIFQRAIRNVIKEANDFNVWFCEFLHEHSKHYAEYLTALHKKIVYPYESSIVDDEAAADIAECPTVVRKMVCSPLVQCYVSGNLEALRMLLEHGVSADLPGVALYRKESEAKKPVVLFTYPSVVGIIAAVLPFDLQYPCHNIIAYLQVLKDFSANFNRSRLEVSRDVSSSLSIAKQRLKLKQKMLRNKTVGQQQICLEHENTPLDCAVLFLNSEVVRFSLPLTDFENIIFAFSRLVGTALGLKVIMNNFKHAPDFFAFKFLTQRHFVLCPPSQYTDPGIDVYVTLSTSQAITMATALHMHIKEKMRTMPYAVCSELMIKLINSTETFIAQKSADDPVLLHHHTSLNCFLTLVIENYDFKPELLICLQKAIALNKKIYENSQDPICKSFEDAFKQYLSYIRPLASAPSTFRVAGYQSRTQSGATYVIDANNYKGVSDAPQDQERKFKK